ncbi:MAG: Lrp/AsnC family transcriptional regulator [Nitrospira sp.]|nr:Lrp/AsnC family transcriptional regulator [Nitrospira sp.]
MDDKDRQLIRLLEINAREPVTSLARKLGMGRATVQDRIARLLKSGAITGFTVCTGTVDAQARLTAYIFVKADLKARDVVARGVSSIVGIRELYKAAGEYDFFALAVGSTTQEIDDIVGKIISVRGVDRTSTGVLLSRLI